MLQTAFCQLEVTVTRPLALPTNRNPFVVPSSYGGDRGNGMPSATARKAETLNVAGMPLPE